MAHHGEILNSIIKRTKITKDELAEKVGVNRRTIFHWIERETLPADIVARVGKAIGVDMRAAAPKVFGEMYDFGTLEPIDMNPLTQRVDLYKDKYIAALEQIQTLRNELDSAYAEIVRLKNV